jgi:hypothetical protein
MRGGTAILCPSCGNRQTVGQPGEKVELPQRIVCEKCSSALKLEKSLSGGAHVTVDSAGIR